MARVNLPSNQPFYDAAQRFVDAALRTDDSLFTPGTPVWSQAFIDDLHRRFVENPDEGGDSFDVKFRRQLQDAPPEVYQLAGELIFVHLLIAAGNIGYDAKRMLIARVLNWSPAPVAIPAPLDQALRHGLARVGTAFLTYRPFQLGFLLSFVRAWKRLPAAERDAALADPWAFKRVLFSQPIHHAYAQREALLLSCIPTPSRRSSRATTSSASPASGPVTRPTRRTMWTAGCCQSARTISSSMARRSISTGHARRRRQAPTAARCRARSAHGCGPTSS